MNSNTKFGKFYFSHIEKDETKNLAIFVDSLNENCFFGLHLGTLAFNNKDSSISFDFERNDDLNIQEEDIINCVSSFIKSSLAFIQKKDPPLYPISGKSFYERPVFKYIRDFKNKNRGLTLCFIYDESDDTFKVSYSKKSKKDKHNKRIANNIAYKRMLDGDFYKIDKNFINKHFFIDYNDYVIESDHKKIFTENYQWLLDDILDNFKF